MSDPPSDDGRRSRSDAASRLAALLADVAEAPTPAPETPEPAAPSADDAAEADTGPPTAAFDLRSLDRLVAEGEAEAGPDPDDAEDDDEADRPAIAVTWAAEAAEAAEATVPIAAPPAPPAPEAEAEPAPEAEAEAEPAPDADPEPEAEAVAGDGPPVRLRRVTLRAVAFGAALLLLVAAIPVLGVVGATRLRDSRGGELVEGSDDPTEEGYRALVVPTLTALVVHRDADDVPRSATLLSLGAGATGGTVLQIPLSTQVRVQRYYVDRLSVAYEAGEDIELFFREVQDRLGVAVQERIDLTDGQLAELVGPVAPLTLSSPDTVLTEEGTEFPAGEMTLAAEDVGPFLRGNAGEDELARLVRNEAVWTAWLEAVGRGGDQAVGSATTTGIGPFLRTLAAGTTVDPATSRVETLDVGPPMSSPLEEPALVPQAGFTAQVIDAVPFPQSPRLGRRYALKLLNGVDGTALPHDLLRDLTLAGASLTWLGNASRFGQDETTIEISGSPWREAAEAAQFVLGDGVEITTMTTARADVEDADIVITIGSDVLDRLEEEGDGG